LFWPRTAAERKAFLVRPESGIDLLLAPPQPESAEHVSSELHHLYQVVDQLRSMYDYVVVDSPAHLEERMGERFDPLPRLGVDGLAAQGIHAPGPQQEGIHHTKRDQGERCFEGGRHNWGLYRPAVAGSVAASRYLALPQSGERRRCLHP